MGKKKNPQPSSQKVIVVQYEQDSMHLLTRSIAYAYSYPSANAVMAAKEVRPYVAVFDGNVEMRKIFDSLFYGTGSSRVITGVIKQEVKPSDDSKYAAASGRQPLRKVTFLKDGSEIDEFEYLRPFAFSSTWNTPIKSFIDVSFPLTWADWDRDRSYMTPYRSECCNCGKALYQQGGGWLHVGSGHRNCEQIPPVATPKEQC